MTLRQTTHYKLQVVEQGDNFWANGAKFSAADRDLIDLLLFLALSGHVHDGAVGTSEPPATAASGSVDSTVGGIPASTVLWYTYTLVNDTTGLETGMAPVTQVNTPNKIDSPARPTLAYGSLGGVLLPGTYYYRLSAYTEVNTAESLAENVQGQTIPLGSTTNRIVITLPDLPDGATGFNIYRRDPGSTSWFYLDSVDMDVATPPDDYEDDGTIELDCDRPYPTVNTSYNTNTVTITLPNDVTPLPDGYHWRLYRTINEDDWSASLLADVVEETFEGSGIYTTVYVDQGDGTTTGEPPSTTIEYGSPSKVLLTDGAHVQGTLPMGLVSGYPVVVPLAFPGVQVEGLGDAVWPCPFDQAIVVAAIAALGPGSTPAADDLICDIQIGRGTTPVFTTVYAAQADMPTIAVGDNKQAAVSPATSVDVDDRKLVAGDVLTGEIIQAGGSATPTDEDLTVNVLLYVLVGSTTTSLTWD